MTAVELISPAAGELAADVRVRVEAPARPREEARS
jgi:hypothetical protein